MAKPQPGPTRCRRKFVRFFPKGFSDPKYLDWERNSKWEAHERWEEQLGGATFRGLLRERKYSEAASRAIKVEGRTHLLFSFEKMAMRDAIKPPAGAKAFAEGLYEYLHGGARPERRFDTWCEVVANLPRKQTRVLTWPTATIFGFLAHPETHFFFKPMVTRRAAEEYGYDLAYRSRPGWDIYSGVLDFAKAVRRDLRDLRPRDMIDVQSFLWVQGSDEYEE